MISIRAAITLFSISLLFFIVILLPVSVVLKLTGLENRMSFSQVDGSILHMNFTDLSVDGTYLGDLGFSPAFPAMIWGDIEGNISFSGSGRQAEVEFALQSSDVVIIEKMTLLMPVLFETNIGILSGALRTHSDGAVISLSDGCRSGTFSLVTTAFDNLFQQIDMTTPDVSGQGSCRAGGIMDIDVVGQSEALTLNVSGQINSNQDWNNPSLELAAIVEPPAGRGFTNDLEQLFAMAGLSPAGRGYRLLLKTGSVGS